MLSPEHAPMGLNFFSRNETGTVRELCRDRDPSPRAKVRRPRRNPTPTVIGPAGVVATARTIPTKFVNGPSRICTASPTRNSADAIRPPPVTVCVSIDSPYAERCAQPPPEAVGCSGLLGDSFQTTTRCLATASMSAAG